MNNDKEYLMLRDEIIWRLKAIDTLDTFTYTAFVGILGIAFAAEIIELCLLSFIIIVPISLKVANHKHAISHVSGYMREFLEDIHKDQCFKWETLHCEFYKKNPRNLTENIIYYGSSIEYIIMCLITSFIFWIYVFQNKVEFTSFQMCIFSFIQVVVILFVTYITVNCIDFLKIKSPILLKWRKVKEEVKSEK